MLTAAAVSHCECVCCVLTAGLADDVWAEESKESDWNT